ncbi:MAG TPA: aspartate-alanine antiporter [Vicinamibacterales bacterium]|nr:aspartate-alanine antiporter [Vicinamibacterales bacterium]
MGRWIIGILQKHPEVAFFLVLGIGYGLGKLKLGSFTLGAVTGTLLAGVAVGQFGVRVSGEVKQAFFLLFLFSIGFRTGPQFFRGLKSDGLQQAALSALVATMGLVVAYGVSRLFGYDAGTAAGVIAGALTESATIGTASDAITRLGLPTDQAAAMVNRIPVAFAVTYLIGVVGAAWFLAQLAPRLMGVNLEEECRRFEQQLHGGTDPKSSARRDFDYRAYRLLPGSALAGRSLGELEDLARDARLFVERLRRNGRVLESEGQVLSDGDTIAVSGRRELLVARMDEQKLGVIEVDDRELLDIPAETLDVVVTSAAVDGRTLAQIADEDFARGVFLRRITRAGTAIPVFATTEIQRGDVLTLVGPSRRIAVAVEHIGVPDRATDVTDMVIVAVGIVGGALIGIPALMLGRLELGLSLPVGVLVGGLTCGWLRSMWPRYVGRIPGPTLWVFESVGLAGFVAVVGLEAGPDFIVGLRTAGVTLVLAGFLTVLVPHLVGVVVGYWIMKMHPGVLLGVCAGAGTATPALAAIQEAAKSQVPTLGYGVSYAVGNVLLALWGTVIVALL